MEFRKFKVNYPHKYWDITRSAYWKVLALQEKIFGIEPTFPDHTTGYFLYDSDKNVVIACAMVEETYKIINVCTAIEHRRKGYMKLLFLSMFEGLRSALTDVDIYVNVPVMNVGARSLYRGLGFVEVGKDKDMIKMTLKLSMKEK